MPINETKSTRLMVVLPKELESMARAVQEREGFRSMSKTMLHLIRLGLDATEGSGGKLPRRGRPTTEPKPGWTHTMTMGASAQLKAAIQKAAKESGRSLSAEMESRLERSFSDDRLVAQMWVIMREELAGWPR